MTQRINRRALQRSLKCVFGFPVFGTKKIRKENIYLHVTCRNIIVFRFCIHKILSVSSWTIWKAAKLQQMFSVRRQISFALLALSNVHKTVCLLIFCNVKIVFPFSKLTSSRMQKLMTWWHVDLKGSQSLKLVNKNYFFFFNSTCKHTRWYVFCFSWLHLHICTFEHAERTDVFCFAWLQLSFWTVRASRAQCWGGGG